jgi:hypothetical protein
MRRIVMGLGMLVVAATVAYGAAPDSSEPQWYIDAEYIEACSCNLFCACYFNPSPDKEFCELNMGVRVKKGNYGDVKLDGMKIWLSGNLGANFGSGEIDGIVFTFEPSASQAQMDAAVKVLTHIYPVKPKKVAIDRAPILWEKEGKTAHAKLGDGEGEVALTQVDGPNGKPVVINNLKYWGADPNKGFNLYRSVHHYKGHGYDYRSKDANGFTVEIESGSPHKS